MSDPEDVDEEDHVDQICDTFNKASHVIQHAILHAMAHIESKNPCLKLLGIEMALIGHAARIRQISQEECGARNTLESFLSVAGDVYKDVSKERPPKL